MIIIINIFAFTIFTIQATDQYRSQFFYQKIQSYKSLDFMKMHLSSVIKVTNGMGFIFQYKICYFTQKQYLLLSNICSKNNNYQRMDNYEIFWNKQISSEGYLQLVIDWDVFIRNFTASIATYAHYDLNQTQREFIRCKIDPQKKGQVCKAAFLLFAQDYWDVPSNRTNLFKMRMNLTYVMPRLNLVTRSTPQRLTLTLTYLSSGKKISKKYEYREDYLFQIDSKGYQTDEKNLKQKGFITIGSGANCDIIVQEALFVNKNHLKIAATKRLLKNQKKSYFQQKNQNTQIVEWFVRDTARSNRMKYVLDTRHKYVFLKPSMVISFGLTGDLQVRITQIDNSSNPFLISNVQQNQIETLLNADRINLMGQVDPAVPLKTTLEVDFKELTPRQIEQMIKDRQYYPLRETITSKGDKKEAPSLSFVIFNKRTFQSTAVTALQPTFSMGRSKGCKYRVNDILVREQELFFRCINGLWMVSSLAPTTNCPFQVNPQAVYLTPLRAIEEGKVSNRIQIREGYPYCLRGREFQVEVELTEGRLEEQ